MNAQGERGGGVQENVDVDEQEYGKKSQKVCVEKTTEDLRGIIQNRGKKISSVTDASRKMKGKIKSDDEDNEEEGETSEEKLASGDGRNVYKKLEMPVFTGNKSTRGF